MPRDTTSNTPDDDIFELTDVIAEGNVATSSNNGDAGAEEIDLSFEDELEELFSDADELGMGADTPPPPEKKAAPKAKPAPAPTSSDDDDFDDLFADLEGTGSDSSDLSFDAMLDEAQEATGGGKQTSGEDDDDPFGDLDFSDLGGDDFDLTLNDQAAPAKEAATQQKAEADLPDIDEEVDFDLDMADQPVQEPAKPASNGADQDDIDDLLGDMDFADLGSDDFDLDLGAEEKEATKASTKKMQPSLVDGDDDLDDHPLPEGPQDLGSMDEDDLLGDLDFSDMDADLSADLDDEIDINPSKEPQQAAGNDDFNDIDLSDLDEDFGIAADENAEGDSEAKELGDTIDQSDIDAISFAEPANNGAPAGDDFDDLNLDDLASDIDADLGDDLGLADTLEHDELDEEVIITPGGKGSVPTKMVSELDDDDDFGLDGLDDLINELDLPDESNENPEPEAVQPDALGAIDFGQDADDDAEESLELDESDLDDLDVLLSGEGEAPDDDSDDLTVTEEVTMDELDDIELGDIGMEDMDTAMVSPADETVEMDLQDGSLIGEISLEDMDGEKGPDDTWDSDEVDFLLEGESLTAEPEGSFAEEDEVTFVPAENGNGTPEISEPPVAMFPEEPEQAEPVLAEKPEPAAPQEIQLEAEHELETYSELEPEAVTQPDIPAEAFAEPASVSARPSEAGQVSGEFMEELETLRARIDELEAQLAAQAPEPAPDLEEIAQQIGDLVEEKFSSTQENLLQALETRMQDTMTRELEAREQELRDSMNRSLEDMLGKALAAESTAVADDVHSRLEESMTRFRQEHKTELEAAMQQSFSGLLEVNGEFMRNLRELLAPEIERIAGEMPQPAQHEDAVTSETVDQKLATLRQDIEARLLKEIPAAAARVIREEITALAEVLE